MILLYWIAESCLVYANSFFATYDGVVPSCRPTDICSRLNTRRLIQSGRGQGPSGSGERNVPVAVYPADQGKKKNFIVSLQRTPSRAAVPHEINQNIIKMQNYSPVR